LQLHKLLAHLLAAAELHVLAKSTAYVVTAEQCCLAYGKSLSSCGNRCGLKSSLPPCVDGGADAQAAAKAHLIIPVAAAAVNGNKHGGVGAINNNKVGNIKLVNNGGTNKFANNGGGRCAVGGNGGRNRSRNSRRVAPQVQVAVAALR
jgi:hypothetical protein